ncbi:hypothetical protein GALMADRAFT_572088 [Galerina marginata CBS 339.88]|uniref:Uncharacterized protein n=1 Tax=Galerina marginata (strain CBS 339.88) TaxID=685588 RepID=A0A067STE8_GALM3|nr:hypothetical protein GALMADRAFT_572088 [Galerina marginata CBS 339.88]
MKTRIPATRCNTCYTRPSRREAVPQMRSMQIGGVLVIRRIEHKRACTNIYPDKQFAANFGRGLLFCVPCGTKSPPDVVCRCKALHLTVQRGRLGYLGIKRAQKGVDIIWEPTTKEGCDRIFQSSKPSITHVVISDFDIGFAV